MSCFFLFVIYHKDGHISDFFLLKHILRIIACIGIPFRDSGYVERDIQWTANFAVDILIIYCGFCYCILLLSLLLSLLLLLIYHFIVNIIIIVIIILCLMAMTIIITIVITIQDRKFSEYRFIYLIVVFTEK